ncbi:MAG: helix-turn-helix transcriptional regulator [Nitrosomonadaceae bacterium]
MKLFDEISNPGKIRHKLSLNQYDFWNKVGITQSGGSRYENGRNMPKPVRELVRLVHIENVDLSKIRKDDLIVARLLKIKNPNLYKSLKKTAKLK